jgi:hypothetical protein
MVQPLDLGKAFGADGPPVQGTIGIALDLFNSSILHMSQYPATPVIHPGTIGFDDHLFFLSLIIFNTLKPD